MKKTKWAAMAAAMLFLVSAYLGTSPALARYLNSEQYFTTHAAENRSLTVEVGQTGAGNFLTSDGAAFLVTGAQNSTLPFTFTNDGSDAKVIRITSTTALGSSADEVFILNPSKSEDPAQTVTDPVVSGTVSKYEKSHTIDGTLAAGIYTVSIEVFEARDVKLTGAKDDTTDPTTKIPVAIPAIIREITPTPARPATIPAPPKPPKPKTPLPLSRQRLLCPPQLPR